MPRLTQRAALGWSFALVGAVALAAGCSGTNTVNYTNPPPPSAAPLATVSVTVALPIGGAPLRSSLRGKRDFSAGNVASVTVQAAASGVQAPVATINTSAGSSNCTSSGGTLSCTGSVQAPVGPAVAFGVVSYSQPNAQGSPLSAGTVVQNVAASGTTLSVSPATFTAVFIASLAVSINNATFTAGTPGQFTFSFNAYDVTGSPITSPATFANAIALSYPANASSGIFGLIPTPSSTPNYFNTTIPLVTGPGQTLSFGYSGLAPNLNPGANVLTFPIAVAGVGQSEITGNHSVTIDVATPTPGPTLLTPSPVPSSTPTSGATTTPSPLPTFTPGPIGLNPSALYFEAPTAPPQTFTASEQGVSSFHAVPLDPTVASVSPSDGTNFTVTPLNAGLTLIIVTDGKGNTNGVDVYVNQIIINPQAKTRFR